MQQMIAASTVDGPMARSHPVSLPASTGSP